MKLKIIKGKERTKMYHIVECKPKQSKEIPWGWENKDGWVVKPRGEIVMPNLVDYFDWESDWEMKTIMELPSPIEKMVLATTAMKSVFTTASRFLGMEEALVQLYTGEIKDGLDKIQSSMLAWNLYLIQSWPFSSRPHIAIQGDEIGSSKGMTMSPDLYRKVLLPLHTQFCTLFDLYNIPIWYHSDGDISAVISDIYAAGYAGIYYEDIGGMKEYKDGIIVQR